MLGAWMSARSAPDLRGTHGLAQHLVTKLPAQSVGSHEVNPLPENPLQVELKRHEAEETDGPIEFDEEVDVAVRPGLIPGDRPEDGQGAHAASLKLLAMSSQPTENFISFIGTLSGPGVNVRPVTIPSASLALTRPSPNLSRQSGVFRIEEGSGIGEASTGTAVNHPAVELANSSTLLPEIRNSCLVRPPLDSDAMPG